MRIPSATQLLETWEQALSLSPTERALCLLAAAEPELSAEELAALPLGSRDARLLKLREALFGTRLQLVLSCPQCSEPIEAPFAAANLLPDGDEARAEDRRAQLHGHAVCFRLPTSADLQALSGEADLERARDGLLHRCVLEARDPQGRVVPIAQLPHEVMAALATQMEAADPASVIELAFACPACGHQWDELFDIGSFLWRELHAWAQRTLRDVHSLARAYGWREADVLGLSPTRRQIYLELCRT